MVFGSDGNLYISCLYAGTVLRFNGTTRDALPGPGQTGANFITPGSGGLVRGGGLTFGPDGNLYVSSQTTDEILRFDGTTGAPLPGSGLSGATFVVSGSNGLSRPAGLVFGPGRADPTIPDLYVVSINTDTIEQYEGTTGNSVGSFIPPRSGGLSKPRGLVFGYTDPSSLLYTPPGPTAPPGGSAHVGRGHRFITAASEAAGFVGLSVERTVRFDLAQFSSTSRGVTRLQIQTSARADASHGFAAMVNAAGLIMPHSQNRNAESMFHAGTGDGVKPLELLSSPLVDLLALNILQA
jgi:hypothetical protein